MRSFKLLQCIKCRDDGYFIQMFSFFFVFLSLPLLVSCLVALWARLGIPEGCLLLELLGGLASLYFLPQPPVLRSSQDLTCVCSFFPPRARPIVSNSYLIPSLLQLQLYHVIVTNRLTTVCVAPFFILGIGQQFLTRTQFLHSYSYSYIM